LLRCSEAGGFRHDIFYIYHRRQPAMGPAAQEWDRNWKMARYSEFEKAAVQRAKGAVDGSLGTFGLLALLGNSVVAGAQRALRRAAIRRELGELDDRILADIGIDPWQVDDIAATIAVAEGAPVPSTKAVLGKLVSRPRRWAAKRRAYAELMELDDRMLRDIGISRSEVEQVVYGNGQDAPAAADDEAEDIMQTIRQWNRSRAAAKTLNALDDRTLDDIGFVRGDIDWVSEELANRSVHHRQAQAA
jgi:uncharacterized protein YjiS (DUF1127 family)